jgi:hypothetical protein
MRRLAFLLVLIAGACDNGHPPQRPPSQNAAQPAPGAPPPAGELPTANTANAIEAAPNDVPPRDDPGLAGLSAAQRRAYELGYRDCSHGRYAPDNHLEAYRIGCGAAHDRMESGRPQG